MRWPAIAGAQSPAAPALDPVVRERLLHLTDRLDAMAEGVAYGCEMEVTSIRWEHGDPRALADTPWAHLGPLLEEHADAAATGRSAAPLMRGWFGYRDGAYTVCARTRIGEERLLVGCCDGKSSFELLPDNRAGLWSRPTSCGLQLAPWSLTRFGLTSYGPWIRAGQEQSTLVVIEGDAPEGGLRFRFPIVADAEAAPPATYDVDMTARITAATDADLAVTRIRITRAGTLITERQSHATTLVAGV